MRSEHCKPERTSSELVQALVALADECHAPAIASEARRPRPYTPRHTLELAVRLRHHLFELQHAIGRTKQQRFARAKALEIARAVAEQQLERLARFPDAVRTRIVARLALARTKFLMGTKVDALLELSLRTAHVRPRRWLRPSVDGHVREVANAHLATFWMRTVREVHTPIASYATTLCNDVESSLSELGEVLPRDAFVDVAQPPLGTYFDEMRTRIRSAHADLDTLLETGSRAITQRLLEFYDYALCAIDARFRERLDAVTIAVMFAMAFADTAHRGGTESVANARSQILAWSSKLDALIDELQ
ncbi:MAG: hypothetical protein AB7T06_36295 [Kofleriaceae bacterium]